MTQCEIILSHIRRYGEISSMEAMELYGICRLAARIGDLRSQGVKIKMIRRKSRNRFGKKIQYGVYTL